MAAKQKNWPQWAPAALKQWFERVPEQTEQQKGFPRARLDFVEKLATDLRMLEFWQWHQVEKAAILAQPSPHKHRLTVLVGAPSVCFAAERATRLPHKPGNMTPGQRKLYFDEVRKHANALIELLQETCFDRGPSSAFGVELKQLDPDEFATTLQEAASWSGMGNELVLAFEAQDGEIYQLPWYYPDGYLIEFLHFVNEWTYWDDCWTDMLRSSKPIAQARTANAKVIYFTRTVYSNLKRYGLTVPFNLLADLTNVALDLPEDQEINEDTARKQVRRYEQKQSELEPRETAFD